MQNKESVSPLQTHRKANLSWRERWKRREISKNTKMHSSQPPIIQTSITIKTGQLSEQLKKHIRNNKQLELLTAISTIPGGAGLSYSAYMHIMEANSIIPWWGLVFLFGVTILLLGVYTGYSIFRYPSINKLVNNIIESLYEDQENTALVLTKIKINETPKLLVKRQESWNSYFLPYCHFQTDDSEESIQTNVKQELSNILELPEHMFIIKAYKNNIFYRIKKNPSNGTVRLIQFRFYSMELKENINRSRFTKSHSSQFSWKSKAELNQDVGTVSNNGDVLAIIDQESLIQKTPYAFKEGLILKEPERSLRIIWTITNKCSYNCSICATNSSRNSECGLTHEEKQKILLNIASINKDIAKLDISGGDPLLDPDDQKLIRQCYQTLPFTKISVTTTATGLDHVPLSEVSNTVRNCDITYDIPYKKYEDSGDPETIKSRPYSYNKTNFDKLISIREAGVDLEVNIHVPIHQELVDREDIQLLLEDLEKMHPQSVKFIQLMPVGRLSPSDIKETYQPEAFLKLVNEMKDENDYKFSVSVNCALKTKANAIEKEARPCPMLEEKLGIDSNGNVFACMWAAYLKGYSAPTENPFYLGNLLTNSLYEILKNTYPKIKELKERYPKGCPVCCVAEETLKSGNQQESAK